MDTVELTCCLIGKVVVHDTDSGRLIRPIGETEGHPVGDAAGLHTMYLSYGTSYLVNVTSEAAYRESDFRQPDIERNASTGPCLNLVLPCQS